jgi:YHS domain-containing protein
MTPLRLFILAVLFYVGWRLFRGRSGRKRPATGTENDSGLQDVLVEDPVCHVLIPKHQALRLRKDGVTYYFCSEQCCDQFAGKPEKGEL